jgi:hypothetical protein
VPIDSQAYYSPAVVRKGLSAVIHGNTCGFAEELVMCGLVRVRKSSPSADIVNKDCTIGWSSGDISQELLKPRSVLEHEAPLRGIGICADNLETLGFRVLLDRGGLVLKRVLLVFGWLEKVLAEEHERDKKHADRIELPD